MAEIVTLNTEREERFISKITGSDGISITGGDYLEDVIGGKIKPFIEENYFFHEGELVGADIWLISPSKEFTIIKKTRISRALYD